MGCRGCRGRGIEASWTRFARSGVEASNSEIKSSNFCFEKRPDRRGEWATIAPRSGPNHRRGRSSGHLDAIPPLKERNRRSIAMRSWCDRDVLPGGFCAVRLESDAPDVFQKTGKNPTSRGRWIAIARSEG